MGNGCAAYLRLQDNTNRANCSFLMGKARPTPIKAVTVQQLRLTAATVSVRVGQMLFKELEVKPHITAYHTDSATLEMSRRDSKYSLQIVCS